MKYLFNSILDRYNSYWNNHKMPTLYINNSKNTGNLKERASPIKSVPYGIKFRDPT